MVMPFQQGEQVGPYRIIEKLGRGGMATVFKAYHANLDRYVAIKVLHPAFMEDPNFLARFQREARVVANLEHPHIIPVYDFAEHDDKTYLVMKFVEGETLKARLQEQPLTPEEGIRIIETVGEALAFAHRQGVLHRDVKPSNVMISDDGQIFLTDFGLARIASAGESTLSSDMMIGTPQYISPEQALGARDLDAGTDIYSFGVLIYELVVGQVPFIADTPFSIIHDHIYTPLPLPRSINPNVPESIERLLLKALAKERNDRFESVEEMVGAFKAGIRGEPIPDEWVDPETYIPPETLKVERPTPPPQPLPGEAEPTKRKSFKERLPKRWWVAIPIVLGLCLCGLVTLSIINEQNAAEPTAPPLDPGSAEVDEGVKPPKPDDKNSLALEEALNRALKRVDENPEDPFAYLELANAYLDLGEMGMAYAEITAGESYAGNDVSYYEVAGDMFATREMWLFALEQYIKVMTISGGDQLPGLLDKFRQTVYNASIDQRAEELLFSTKSSELRTQFAKVIVPTARARFTLYHGDPNQALEMVDRVLETNPDVPEARLVKAEALIELGRYDEAEEILNVLFEEEMAPWLKVEVRRLRTEIE
jgi:serine/threonine protein kinase